MNTRMFFIWVKIEIWSERSLRYCLLNPETTLDHFAELNKPRCNGCYPMNYVPLNLREIQNCNINFLYIVGRTKQASVALF